MKLLCTLSCILFFAQNTKADTLNLYSDQVNDSFTVIIHGNSSASHLIFYLDADQLLGRRMNDFRNSDTLFNSDSFVFVGIAHQSNHRKKRQRDFIQPVRDGKEFRKKDYGYADSFLRFISMDVMSLLDSQYHFHSRTFVGHSLSGLFGMYAVLETKKAFDNYLLISPSLWVNSGSIIEMTNATSDTSSVLKVFMTAGANERINRVGKGVRDMGERLYLVPGIEQIRFKLYPGMNHRTNIPISLKDGLYWFNSND